MTTPADRFRNWIDSLADTWKERLRGWMASWVSWGIELFADILGKGLSDQMPELLSKMEEASAGSPEIQELIKRARLGGGQWQALLLGSVGGAALGGGVSSALFPPLEKMKQFMSAAIPFQLSPVGALIALHYRELISDETYTDQLHKYGFDDAGIKMLEDSFLFYPSPGDLVRWQAREVFEPKMISKYGLDAELGEIEREPFYKAGMTDEQITNYWRAHWEHASWMQVVEMLHRGLLKEEDVWDWFRLVEIPPFWRQSLIDTAYTWPTRVDVRRWWDMRTIDETRLRELYSGMGYRGKNLDDYVLWTKVYVAFPDLMARWSKGWISLDDVRAELAAFGMPRERLEEFIQMKVAATEPGRIEGEREITKTDIYKGVKQGIIDRSEGIELLQDLGFDEDEADYLLTINIPPDEEKAVVTTRELTKADILNGLKTGVLSKEEAQIKLVELRYTSEDARTILDIFTAAAEPPVEAWQKEASKADIVAAVKTGLITPENAYLMLQDIGFSPEAANFILMVRAEVSPFSPMSYNEFKDITTKYRRAAGREVRPMPEELKKAADVVVRVTAEIESLKRSIEEEERGLIDKEVLPAETTARLTELQVSLHRAEAELSRVKSEYDRLVAEWRHGSAE